MSEETITISRAEYEALRKQNEELLSLKKQYEELSRQLEYLKEEFNLAQKHRFGSSSEKNKVNNKRKFQIIEIVPETILSGSNTAHIKPVLSDSGMSQKRTGLILSEHIGDCSFMGLSPVLKINISPAGCQ
jgi:hypothetical protein